MLSNRSTVSTVGKIVDTLPAYVVSLVDARNQGARDGLVFRVAAIDLCVWRASYGNLRVLLEL